MPVWQRHYAELKSLGADLLSVAVDLQGPERPRLYHQQAGAEFVTVVDDGNRLAGLLGYRAVPNGFFFDQDGNLLFKHMSGFDVAEPETLEAVMQFASSGRIAKPDKPGEASDYDYYEQGFALFSSGDVEGAKAVWRKGIDAEPDHWNLRKQVWALENPDKFYDGPVDYGWQKEQIKAGV